MSLASSPSVSSPGFALQSRLFLNMKRAGRIIDVAWFQQNAEYARAVLGAAESLKNEAISEIANSLREELKDFLSPARVTVLSVAKPVVPPAADEMPAPAAEAEAAAAAAAPTIKRYVGSLR